MTDVTIVELNGLRQGEIWPGKNTTKANSATPANSVAAIGFNFSVSAPVSSGAGGAGAGKVQIVRLHR